MTKKGMARITYGVNQLEQIRLSVEESLVEVIQSSFSALATSSPELALSVLEQINMQKKGIESLAKEREQDEADFINDLSSKLPDSLEFEEDAYEQ